MSGADKVLVTRDLLAAACHVLRRYVPDSKTLAELSAIALSPADRPAFGDPGVISSDHRSE